MRKNHIFLSLGLILTSTVTFASAYKGLGKQSVSEATIRKFAPTPLDPALENKIQNMLDIRAPGSGVISPDGKALFFGWGVTGTSQIWKIDGPDTFPIQLTGGKSQTWIEDITPDGKWLIVSRDENGEENPGLYLLSPKGGALIEIQKKTGIQTQYSIVSDDSNWIYYSSNDISPENYALYRYNIGTQKKELLLQDPGIWSIADDRDNKLLLLEKEKGSNVSEFYEFDIQTQKLKPVIGQNENEEYSIRFAPNKGEYFVLTPKLANFRTLYLYKNGNFTPISGNEPYDVSSFRVERPRKKIYITRNEKGYHKVFALDAKTFKSLPLPKMEGLQISLGDISRDGKYATFRIVTSRAPATSYVYDWKNKKLTRWVIPSSPEIDTSSFAEDSLEYYPARDGTQIPIFVKRPEGCKNKTCPVIVDFHGGPEAQSIPGFYVSEQLYVEEGFILVNPNVRGSDGYGKKWVDADNIEKRLQIITDIEDCAKFIKKEWAFNGIVPKIGVMGGSYGGYTTLMAMTYFAGTYDAGVSNVGISNLVTFLNNTAPYRRILRINEYGDPVKDKDLLTKLSPITHISKTKAPLLVIQGVNDPRVPVGEAIQIYTELEKRKIPTGLILFGDEGHGAQKRDNVVQQIGHTVSFFKKYLK